MIYLSKYVGRKIWSCIWAFLTSIAFSAQLLPAAFFNLNSVHVGITNNSDGFKLTSMLSIVVFLLGFFVYYYACEVNFKSKKDNFRILVLAVLYAFITCFGISYARYNNWSMIFGNFRSFLFFLFVVVVFSYFFISLIKLGIVQIPNLKGFIFDRNRQIRSKKLCFGLFFIFWGCWMLWLFVFFPGNVSGDGFNQLDMFFKFKVPSLNNSIVPMSNHHPYLSTLFSGYIVQFGRKFSDNFGIFLFNFIQILITSGLYTYIFLKLKKIGVRSKILIFVAFFVGIMPFWSSFNIEVGKEGLFFAFFYWFTAEVMDIIIAVNKGQKVLNRQVVLLTISGLLVCFWRNNGIYSVLPTLIVLTFVKKRIYWKKMLFSLVTVLIVYGGFTNVVLPLRHVEKSSPAEALSIPIEQTARYLKYYPNDISSSEKKILTQTFQDYSQLGKAYDPLISDNVKGQFKSVGKQDIRNYLTVWMQMGLKHPSVYVQSFLNGSFYYYYPWSNSPRSLFRMSGISEWGHPKELNVHYTSPTIIRNVFNNISDAMYSLPIISVLFNAAVYLWLLLFIVLNILNKKMYSLLVPFIPVFMNVLVCIASPVNGEIRYSGVIQICSLLLVVFYLYNEKIINK